MNEKAVGRSDDLQVLDGRSFRDLSRAVFRRCLLVPGQFPADKLERVLESTRWAPSLANQQPWLLASAAGAEARALLDQLAERPGMFEDPFSLSSHTDASGDLKAAGAVVVLMGERESPFWRESLLLATYQVMLASAAEGLAARALVPRSPNDMAEWVKVPREYLVFSLVLLGKAGDPEANTMMLKPLPQVSVPLSQAGKPADGRGKAK